MRRKKRKRKKKTKQEEDKSGKFSCQPSDFFLFSLAMACSATAQPLLNFELSHQPKRPYSLPFCSFIKKPRLSPKPFFSQSKNYTKINIFSSSSLFSRQKPGSHVRYRQLRCIFNSGLFRNHGMFFIFLGCCSEWLFFRGRSRVTFTWLSLPRAFFLVFSDFAVRFYLVFCSFLYFLDLFLDWVVFYFPFIFWVWIACIYLLFVDDRNFKERIMKYRPYLP